MPLYWKLKLPNIGGITLKCKVKAIRSPLTPMRHLRHSWPLLVTLAGCGSGPNDTCRDYMDATASAFGQPDLVENAGDMEQWFYLSKEFVRVFDWRSGSCVVIDHQHAYPRPDFRIDPRSTIQT
jgi:hypothetical protein